MRFELFHIPITIHPSFWLFLVFFSFAPDSTPQQMAIWGIILIASLLTHELGHAFAALKFGVSPEITMEAFGGYTSYPSAKISTREQFFITLAGPLFTALLIGLPYYFLKNQLFAGYWPNYICFFLMHLNIYWLAINLTPLQPLDGGKIATYLLHKKWGLRGEWLALHLGTISAILGAAYFLRLEDYPFTLLFAMYGFKNFQESQAHALARNPTEPFTLLNSAVRLSAKGDDETAHLIFKRLSRSRDPFIRTHATEGLADSLTKLGKLDEAYRLLLNADTNSMRRGNALFLELAYRFGDYALAAKRSHQAYQVLPTFGTALLNAKIFARIGDEIQTNGWLETARQFEESSSADWEQILADPAFDYLHNQLIALQS